MSDTSPVPSPQRTKPPKAREEAGSAVPASRIPVKQRPAQPPLHVRHTVRVSGSGAGGGGGEGYSCSTVPVRRGRSFSITPNSSLASAASTKPLPQIQPQKRAASTDPQPAAPSPSPTQSLTLTSRMPVPSPPLSRSNGASQQSAVTSQIPRHLPPSSSSLPPYSSTTPSITTAVSRPAQSNFYKRAQSVAVTSYATAEAARQRLIERATKARLYLLHRIGPNRFLIGGDSLDSRFYVTIGPQNCTCGKPHCIHLLFVMLRVMKVSPGDPLLFSKQLRNYETESLLMALHARNTLRTTPRKINKRRFDFSASKMATETGRPHSICKTETDDKEEDEEVKTDLSVDDPEVVSDKVREEGDGEDGGGEGVEREESDKSEEEDVCPICLNELDEGEDLITCRRCGNRLHQHCMDIWAGEQIRKKELVQCPVCRTSWQQTTPSPAKPGGQSFLQVSVPVGSEVRAVGGVSGGLRLKSLSPSQHVQLSREKAAMLEKIRKVFGEMVMEGVLSPDWKSREMAIAHTSRQAISLLLPQMKAGPGSGEVAGPEWRDVQEAVFLVIVNGCSDSVLKVFLASLELLRVVMGYTICSTEDDSDFLQTLLKPLIFTLLTRCADAQSRVKKCSIDTVCHFSLGQEGPLSLSSACGQTSPFCVSSLPFVVRCALARDETAPETQSWHWWLGRLNFFERMIHRFSWDFLLENCTYRPPLASPTAGPEEESPVGESLRTTELQAGDVASDEEGERACGHAVLGSDQHTADVDYLLPPPPPFPGRFSPSLSPAVSPSVHPTAEENLLVQALLFAAQATHVPHNKVGKMAQKVIIRLAKVLRNEPFSLEIMHEVVSRCHRTHAEGLLDRVLTAREKAAASQEEAERKRETPTGDGETEEKEKSALTYTPFPETQKHRQSPKPRTRAGRTPERRGGVSPVGVVSGGRRLSDYGSDDSYRSAVSDLSGEEREGGEREEERRPEGASSSGGSSDSKSGEKGGATGGGSGAMRLPKYYKRQTTVDSALSSGSVSTEPETSGVEVFQCKRNIEEEEAAAEAKVRSLLPEDSPHPSLYGIKPPNPEVLIHVQASGGAEGSDSGAVSDYLEGKDWVKGKLIGTGAFCSCFLARDTRLGTMMAVKQVSYVRNTKTEEEAELKRLHEEIMMLGRLSHPNIVRCLGATQHEGHINIFIEWMAGGCLDQVLHDFGRFAESVISNYTRQIIYGIVYLHEHGIIHRDLKGGNVLLDSTGQRVRIADFGAAARLASHTTGQGEFQDMEGTVAFMAPEVVRGGTTEEGSATGYGRKCDVWSIGCVIIQMASGKPPWAGTYDVKNKFQLIFKIGQATEPPPMPHFSDPALKDLTLRCLEVNPDDRPVSSELLKHPLFTSS